MGSALVPLVDELFWYNDGSAAITNLASGSVRWFDPTGTPGLQGLSVDGVGDTTSWKKFDVEGCEFVDIQLSSKIVALGGMTAVAGASCFFNGSGCFESSMAIFPARPRATQMAPSLVSNVATDGSNQSLLWSAAELSTGGMQEMAGSTNNMSTLHGLLAVSASPQVDHLFQAVYRIGRKPNLGHNALHNVTGTAGYLPLTVAGTKHIWLALGFGQTYTGATVANMRIQAEVRVVGWGREGYNRKVRAGRWS